MSNNDNNNNGRIDFEQLEENLGRMIKKQKSTLTKTLKDIDSIVGTLSSSKKQLELFAATTASQLQDDEKASDSSKTEQPKSTFVPIVVGKLYQSLSESKQCQKVQSEHKELHSNISKTGKLVDKNFRSDIEKSTKGIEFDPKTVNKIILYHFYREGKFDVADLFADEIGVKQSESEYLKARFTDHHDIIKSMEIKKDLQPAINWCKQNRQELHNLEFKLQRLQFIHLLSCGKTTEALGHAKSTFSEFANTKMRDIQTLMGAFIYANRLKDSPYAYIFAPQALKDHWSDIKDAFARESYRIMGVPQESPLAITVNVGVSSLPTFIKLSTFSVLQKANDDSNSLTVEINVDQKYKFHSIFACPVSREQCTKDNPPVLLICGHLISLSSMNKLVKGSGKLKCPYCPTEQHFKEVLTTKKTNTTLYIFVNKLKAKKKGGHHGHVWVSTVLDYSTLI
ncbi:hypothetical protein DFA_05179 [Cavenderia fasciculata]|uniref:Uncharacterized protein n=1 Tax=Cavenderia fasciculata TaxID=261658 RepID=F4PNJ6_CACFS|nr:uncharacterized protein DFA_05179 [Cavenderia fasciculata]EGG23049.1 hypothetical protein DFA_05179 [Cavenderia fasciculata]|eukprot:XP_004360900.1 hypothetical protein DFA_05179 [Cavenderia fasciculata]